MKFFISIFMLLFVSCGGANVIAKVQTVSQEKDQIKTHNEKKEFSVVPFDIDDINFSKMEKKSVPEKTFDNDSISSVREERGWRIQVAVLKNFDRCNEIMAQLEEQLSETSHNVYRTYYSPNFRLRVGNFKTREEARKVLPLIKELGYKDAWAVRDKIFIYE